MTVVSDKNRSDLIDSKTLLSQFFIYKCGPFYWTRTSTKNVTFNFAAKKLLHLIQSCRKEETRSGELSQDSYGNFESKRFNFDSLKKINRFLEIWASMKNKFSKWLQEEFRNFEQFLEERQ